MKQESTTEAAPRRLDLDGKLMLLAIAPVTVALLAVLLSAELLFPKVLQQLAQDPQNPGEARILAEELEETLGELRRILLSVGSGALFASLGASVILSRKLRDRLRKLSETASRIEQEDLSARVNDTVPDQIGQVGHALDRMVTALQDARARVSRTERLAAIGQLGASVAHELRNPLGAIVTSLALIGEKLARNDTAIERHLTKIQRNTEDANRIISDLLSYARVKEPYKKSISTVELFNAALSLAPTPSTCELKQTNPEHWPALLGDKEQLAQVVSNLLTNAYQATEDKGVVAVSAYEEPEHCVFMVEDNGPGVPKEKRAEIFEPLVTSKAKGTGLGLALCAAIIHGHGGEITVEDSTLGGAKFVVTLPNQRRAATE